MKTIGERVKDYVDQHGIKQTFLAGEIGISISAMSQFLNGNRKIDALEYYKMCKALHVPMEFFMEED